MCPPSSKESLQGVISDCLATEASVGMESAGGQAQCWSEAESRKGSGTASPTAHGWSLSGLEDRRGSWFLLATAVGVAGLCELSLVCLVSLEGMILKPGLA